MYKTVADTVKYVKEFRGLVKDIDATSRSSSRRRSRRSTPRPKPRATATSASPRRICYWEREGAFTGEISAPMIREAGAEYVIVGHSERRTLFGETDASVNRKTAAAFAGRAHADRLHRRDARSARAQRDVRRARPPDSRSGSTASPPSSSRSS